MRLGALQPISHQGENWHPTKESRRKQEANNRSKQLHHHQEANNPSNKIIEAEYPTKAELNNLNNHRSNPIRSPELKIQPEQTQLRQPNPSHEDARSNPPSAKEPTEQLTGTLD